jgi:integrase/recombinase XerD
LCYRQSTRALRVRAYGRWLTHLAGQGELDRAIWPGDRVTPKRIGAYVATLRQQCASSTVWSKLVNLYAMLSVALAPDQDWSWLRRIVSRLHAVSAPARPIEPRLRSSRELFAEGLGRMRAAEIQSDLSPMARAVAYRDGLMIALLAACPLRRRTFAGLKLGRHLVRLSGHYFVRLEPRDLKNATALDFPVPEVLTPYLERYLQEHRPRLLQDTRTDALWITRDRAAMSQKGLGFRVAEITKRWFGSPITPHLFRHAAATSMAIDDPHHARLIAGLLGHRTLRTAERYYNKAQALEAARSYDQAIGRLRRRLHAERPDRQRSPNS